MAFARIRAPQVVLRLEEGYPWERGREMAIHRRPDLFFLGLGDDLNSIRFRHEHIRDNEGGRVSGCHCIESTSDGDVGANAS